MRLARTANEPRADDRREEILEAALRVFSDEGYARATTKEIANAAGIRSPALIYWYFSSKEVLLREVFLRYAVVLEAAAGNSPPLEIAPELALPQVARAALAFFDDVRVRRVYRLWMAEWPRLEQLGISLEKSKRANNVYTATARYLDRQVELGNLKPHDTWVAARAFIALVWSQVEARHLFPSIYPTPPGDDEYVDRMVAFFLSSLKP